MDVPTYSAEVTVGGTEQSIQFSAFPDSLINRQSGDITIIHKDASGQPYDISSLTGSDFKTVPFESGETPTTLAVGTVGFTQEIFTIDTGSTVDTSGTFVLRVAGENTTAIPYNSDAAAILVALNALTSRTSGDFVVSIASKENLGFAGASILVTTSGGFAIEYDSTLDSALLPNSSITLSTTQSGSSVANEYNANWDKDSIPAAYSEFEFDKSGAIAFYIALEDATDFYQVYQRINVEDDAFVGTGGTVPSSATYVYNPVDNNAWLRHTTSAPVTINDALDIYARQNFSDFGAVISEIATPPVSPSDGDAYLIIATATGDFLGLEGQIARYSSTLAAWQFSNVHRNWDRVRNESDGELYRYNTTGSTWDLVSSGAGDMEISTYDAALVSEQLVGLTAAQALTNKSVNAVTLSAAGAATAFLNETGAYSTPAGGGDMTIAVYDAAAVTEQLVGLTATQTLTNKSVNGVSLSTAGAATAYLDETGAYSTPAGGSALPVVDTTSIVEGNTDATKEMRIDVETNVATATTRVLTMPDTDVQLYAQGYITPTVTATTDIDFSLGGSFSLGTLLVDVTLTFSNIKQGQTVSIQYTSTDTFDLIALPGTVTVLNGGGSTADANNTIWITATQASTVQQASYSLDTAISEISTKTISDLTYTLTDDDLNFIIYFDNAAGCTVSLNTGLVTNFNVSLAQDTATSVITLDGTATLKSGSSTATAVDNDIMIVIPRPTTDEYLVTV